MIWLLAISPASIYIMLFPLILSIPTTFVILLFVPFLLLAQDLCTSCSFVLGSSFILLKVLNTYMFSSVNDAMCVEYYENDRGDIEPLSGGSQRLPKSPGPLV